MVDIVLTFDDYWQAKAADHIENDAIPDARVVQLENMMQTVHPQNINLI